MGHYTANATGPSKWPKLVTWLVQQGAGLTQAALARAQVGPWVGTRGRWGCWAMLVGPWRPPAHGPAGCCVVLYTVPSPGHNLLGAALSRWMAGGPHGCLPRHAVGADMREHDTTHMCDLCCLPGPALPTCCARRRRRHRWQLHARMPTSGRWQPRARTAASRRWVLPTAWGSGVSTSAHICVGPCRAMHHRRSAACKTPQLWCMAGMQWLLWSHSEEQGARHTLCLKRTLSTIHRPDAADDTWSDGWVLQLMETCQFA